MGRLAQGAVELEHSGPGANKVHSQQNIHHQQYDLSRRLCDAVLQVCGGRCACFSGGDGEGYKYAIGLRGGDLRSFVRELNQALDGRGGGRPDFVQGSVRAGRTAIEEFLSAEKQR